MTDKPNFDELIDTVEIKYDYVSRVLEDLRPGCEFVTRGHSYEDIQWKSSDIDKPSKEEFEKRKIELGELWEKDRYKRKRRIEYPKWEELADAMYHKENGNDLKMVEYLQKIQAIKDKYPKPE
jgi:hypothetical protein